MLPRTSNRVGVLFAVFVCVLGLTLLVGCGTTRGVASAPSGERVKQVPRIDSQNLDQHPNAAVLQWVAAHPTWSQGWAELTTRMKVGQLTDDDALVGMRILIDCLETQTPTGNPVAFSRADLFVAELYDAGLIDDATLRVYTKAFVGEAFRFNNGRAVTGSRFMRVYGWFGTNVEEMLGSGLPYELIWQVREVRLDGELITPSRIEYPLTTSVAIILDPHDYAVGLHRVEVILEAGLALREEAADFKPRRTQANDWPETRLRWRVKHNATITIEEPATSVLD